LYLFHPELIRKDAVLAGWASCGDGGEAHRCRIVKRSVDQGPLRGGKVIGSTPITETEIEPGTYEVVVTDPKYFDAGETITMVPGDKQKVSVTL